MKNAVSFCTNHPFTVILFALVFAQAVVFADPCYVPSGTPYACPHQSVAACSQIQPNPAIACASGPWTLAQLASQGKVGLTPCAVALATFNIPPDNSFDADKTSGYMSIGDQDYACLAMKNCTKVVTLFPPPFLYSCTINPLQTCDTITVRNTASGAACPQDE